MVFTLELLLRGYFEKPRNIVFDPWNLSAGPAVLLGPKFLPPGAKRVVYSLYTVESLVNIVHNTFLAPGDLNCGVEIATERGPTQVSVAC